MYRTTHIGCLLNKNDVGKENCCLFQNSDVIFPYNRNDLTKDESELKSDVCLNGKSFYFIGEREKRNYT